MKNLTFLKWMLGAVLSLSLMLTACGRTNKNDNSLRGGGGATDAAGVSSVYSDKCASGASAIGMIFNDGTMNFQNQVAAYVSSWMSPADLGTVDGSTTSSQTGIDLKGKLKFNSANQIIVEQSGLEITIIDSLTAQGQPAIAPANYNQKAVLGTIDPTNKKFEVVFKDNYGQLKITGQFDANYASGYIQFINSKAVAGYTPQSGTLGAFKISKCGLLD